MNSVASLVLLFAVLCSAHGDTINHDQVQPFTQPNPITIAEKAAIKFKPQLLVDDASCVSFPAVNAAGEITGGLKGTKGTNDCKEAPLGSQVYGRSAWYQDKWAMMFAFYFPENFWGGGARSRHNWANMVVWIDNPALETPKILGASLSQQTLEPPKALFLPIADRNKDPYQKLTDIPASGFAGTQAIRTNKISRRRWNYTYVGGSNTSTRVVHTFYDGSGWISLKFSHQDGQYQDLIMWEQLTDKARAALDSADFGEATVPVNDKNFEAALGQAWPYYIGMDVLLKHQYNC